MFEVIHRFNSLNDAVLCVVNDLLKIPYFRGFDDKQLTEAALEWIVEV
jgi:hypothetical protein